MLFSDRRSHRWANSSTDWIQKWLNSVATSILPAVGCPLILSSLIFLCLGSLFVSVMTLESCHCVMFRLCFCLIFSCLCIMSLYHVFWVSMPHCVSCPLSFSYVLPSVSLCLLHCSLHVFSCAPPPCHHTWPPPSSLSPPVPCLIVSVCQCVYMTLKKTELLG